MSSIKSFPLFCSIAFAISAPLSSPAEPPSIGPFYDEFPLTLTPGHGTEVLGPLFYDEHRETQHTWAFPPLLSYTHDPALETVEFDFVYPVLTYDRYGGQYRWQFFQLLSLAGGPTQTEKKRNRFTIFPIYFQQRSSDPSENYTAYGPFYGHLQHRLMRDKIIYVMFPFYSETWKGQVVTHNYLYPFFHLRNGPGLKGWQVWPITGHEHKDVTTRTNSFDEVETVPGHDKWFALWPIYFQQRTEIGTTNATWRQGVLPAYAMLRSPARDSTTVLWPFFSRINDRERGYREWTAPWPLVEFARGPGLTMNRVIPFFSRGQNTNLLSVSYAWPIYRHTHLHSDPLDRKRTRILFWLYSDLREKNTETGALHRRIDCWPFFTKRRDLNGNTRLQVLAPLEPFVPGSHKIKRDYSPIWSVWRAEKNPSTGATSQSLLWNLYRRDARPGYKKVSALFGLYQYRSDAEGTRRKILFIPFGGRKSPAPQGNPGAA